MSDIPFKRVPRYAYVFLALIALAAAIFRFVQLDYAPSGGHGDVAWIGINALDWVDRGIWPFYVRELYAPEPFPVYLTGLLLPLTGISFLPQRIVTAIWGVLFVVFLFPACWWLLEGKETPFHANAGLFAALAGAVSLHVVALNRLGMESPPFLTMVALLVWLTAKAWRRGKKWDWIFAGVALGLAQYVFLAARLLPVVLALWIAHSGWADRSRLRTYWRGWLVMALVSFVVTLPALILFVTTPEAFSARADAGTAQTGGWIWQFDTSAYGGVAGLVVQKIGLTLLAFGIEWRGPYNIMNLPMLGPLFFVGFLAAVPFALRNFRQIAYGWPLLAIPVMLFTDLISGAVLEIHALHQMGVLPFVYILSGIGLAHLWQLVLPYLTRKTVRLVAVCAAAALALIPAVMQMNHYLSVIIPAQYADPESGWRRAQTDVDIGQYLAQHSDKAFLLPYSEYNRSDVAWVLADGFRERRSAIASGGTLQIENPPQDLIVVLPAEPERPRHDGFPAHFDPRLWVLLHDNGVWLLPPLSADQADDLAQTQAAVSPEILRDRSQTEIASLFEVPTPVDFFDSHPVIDYPLEVTFNDEVRLLGYTLEDQNLEPGHITYVSLYWQVIRPPSEDYEVFVQFWSDNGESIGGAHDFPYGGMYRTRIWQPDEIVTTHHWIALPDDIAPGRYTLVAGLYRLLHNERLPVSGPNANPEIRAAQSADLRVPLPIPQAAGEAPPTTIRAEEFFTLKSLSVELNDLVQMGDQWQAAPGDTVNVDLFWDVLNQPDVDYSVFLHLSAGVDIPPAAQVDVPMGGALPSGVWQPGDLIHDRLALQIPDDLPSGTYDVLLGVYFWQTGERLNFYRGTDPEARDRVILGQVTVASPS